MTKSERLEDYRKIYREQVEICQKYKMIEEMIKQIKDQNQDQMNKSSFCAEMTRSTISDKLARNFFQKREHNGIAYLNTRHSSSQSSTSSDNNEDEASCDMINGGPDSANPDGRIVEDVLDCQCSMCKRWGNANQMFICNECENAYHHACLYPGEVIEHNDRRYYMWVCFTCLLKRDPPKHRPKRKTPDNQDDYDKSDKATHEVCYMVSTEPNEEEYEITTNEAPKELEEGGQNTIDELIEVNLENEERPRPMFISASLPDNMKEMATNFLKEYIDCFTWSYYEMPGLDPQVATYRLKIDPECKPIKQAPHRMRVELEEQVFAKTKKLLDAGFV